MMEVAKLNAVSLGMLGFVQLAHLETGLKIVLLLVTIAYTGLKFRRAWRSKP